MVAHVRPTRCEAIPESDLQLHSCSSSLKQSTSVKMKPSVTKRSEMKPVAARRKKRHPRKDSEDLDTMLAEMTLLDSRCHFLGCKRKVNLLSLQCHLCRKRFCMEHIVPEVHGCSELARKHARQAAVKPKTAASRKDSFKRAQLHKKLESKLEVLSSERKSKTTCKSKT